jgi:hypothetical protein
MAKETKKQRSRGGKKGFKTRLANARAAGKKTIKIGKRRISTTTGKAVAKGGSRKLSKTLRKGIKRERARREGQGKALARSTRKRSSRRRKPIVKHKHHHHTKVVTKRRTVEVAVPGKTRKVFVTAAERRGRRRHGRRRAREGYAMENPLSTTEIIAGGLTMLLGLAVADVSDRYWATHALTASTSGTTTTYTDTPTVTSSTSMATFGAGLYPNMLNGAAVIAPMNLTRWVSGGVLAAVPFLAAAYTKQPTVRTALQLFGFGVIARIGGKALVDLFAGLLGSTQLGQQLYVNELAATGQYQAAMGQTVTVTLPSPGTNPPAAGGPGNSASGLGKAPQGTHCCAACAVGRPCTVNTAPATPQPTTPPAVPSSDIPTNLPSNYTPGVPNLLPPTIGNTAAMPNTTNVPVASTPLGVGDPRRLPHRPNPYAWGSHINGGSGDIH